MATLRSTRAATDFPGPYLAAAGAGLVHAAWGRYVFAANPTAADIVKLCRLPACVVVGGAMWATDIDTGTEELDIDLGHGGNAVDSADPDAFGNFGVLTGDAITDLIASGVYRPINLSSGPIRLQGVTDVQAVVNTDAAAGGTGTLSAVIFYVADDGYNGN